MTRTSIHPWALALVAVVALLAGACSDSGDDAGPTTTSTELVIPDELDPDAAELLTRLQAARGATVHARYVASGDLSEVGGALTVEVWRDGEQFRYDSAFETEQGRIASTTITDGETVVSCQRLDDGDWSCIDATDRQEGDVFDLEFQQAVYDLGARPVEKRADEIAGVPVDCYTTSDDQAKVEVCVTADGVQARLASDATMLDLEVVDDDIPDGVFDPPAEVGQA